jgi:hypothetical protein
MAVARLLPTSAPFAACITVWEMGRSKASMLRLSCIKGVELHVSYTCGGWIPYYSRRGGEVRPSGIVPGAVAQDTLKRPRWRWQRRGPWRAY